MGEWDCQQRPKGLLAAHIITPLDRYRDFGIDYPREKQGQPFAAQPSFLHCSFVPFVALGTDQHSKLTMNRVLTP